MQSNERQAKSVRQEVTEKNLKRILSEILFGHLVLIFN